MAPAHRKPLASRQRRTFRLSRDTVLFVVGLLGVAHETLIANADRPTLLLLFGAMVGLPAFLRQDEKKINKTSTKDRSETPSDGDQQTKKTGPPT